MNYKNIFFPLFILFIAIFITSCESKEDLFKQTEAGKALYRCVASDGNLTVEDVGDSSVKVTLKKNKQTVILGYKLNPDLNQAKFIGGEIVGEKQPTKLVFAFTLLLMCGDSISDTQLL